ncbi:MAG: hypothetical protein CEE43_14650 [Promethearchaeota archaeon Loki_b32]|nr:MAG: hypothetical protein CEE43_14650 [Candidatus Lokiarchaeota archaeon Loki_b32]
MSRDLKDMINTVEKNSKSHAELEQKIQSMKEEVNRMNFTIREQKLLIQNLQSQMKDEEIEKAELPSEIDILKDMITSQRQELNEKEIEIEKLNVTFDELTAFIENNKDSSQLKLTNKEFLEAQTRIVKLKEENEDYKNQIEFLQNKFEDLESRLSEDELFIEDEEEPIENEELINIKRLNFQLMEENGLLRMEVESLKARFQERLEEAISNESELSNDKINELSSELEFLKTNFQGRVEEAISKEAELANEKTNALTSEIEELKARQQEQIEKADTEDIRLANEKINTLTLEIEDFEAQVKYLQEQIEKADAEDLRLAHEKINTLTSEIENLEAQVKYLQEQLEKPSKPVIVSTEDALQFAELREEFDDTKTELLKIQKENQILNQTITELKEKQISAGEGTNHELPEVPGLTKRMQQSLFFRMYYLLDDFKKEKVINYLIQDLKSANYQIKRNAIKILSVLKNQRIYDTFLEMVNDNDWIVRYSIIKALSKFEDKDDELKLLLKHFSRDVDVDVRELALKILKDFSN